MIHETLIEAPRWAIKIEKESTAISKRLNELIDTVDRFWHNLEGQYDLQLVGRMDIIKLDRPTRQVVALNICKHLDKNQDYIDIPTILTYLRRKGIP